MGKHQYEGSGEGLSIAGQKIGEWHKCRHCGDVIALDAWQLKRMPQSLAKCSASPLRRSFWEWISGTVNCMSSVR